jgi:hypothetical protein
MAIENTSAGSRLMDMIKSGSKGANKSRRWLDVWRNRSSKVIPSLRWTDSPHFERYDTALRPEDS